MKIHSLIFEFKVTAGWFSLWQMEDIVRWVCKVTRNLSRYLRMSQILLLLVNGDDVALNVEFERRRK